MLVWLGEGLYWAGRYHAGDIQYFGYYYKISTNNEMNRILGNKPYNLRWGEKRQARQRNAQGKAEKCTQGRGRKMHNEQ